MPDESQKSQLRPGDLKPVVEAERTADVKSAVLLDVRTAAAFAAGHAPAARRVPIERWEAAARAADTSFANVAYWENEIGALGIDGSQPVFVYDDGRLTEAARVWFILQHFGVRSSVVNGGWPHLRGLGIETGEEARPSPVAFTAVLGSGQVGLAGKEEVLAALDGAERILDVRTKAEFTGEDQGKNPRGGHLPGAVHLAHTELIGSDGRLRPAEELRGLFSKVGLAPGDRIITHCQGGGRAALAALAALTAGYGNIQNYYLSFADWAQDESCPITR